MAWSSDEYIGRHGTQLEFTSIESIGSMMISKTNSDTIATLVKKNGNFVTESDLRITVLAVFSTASITCIDVGHKSSSIIFQLLGMYNVHNIIVFSL